MAKATLFSLMLRGAVFVLLSPWAGHAQQPGMDELIERIEKRTDSYKAYSAYKVNATTTETMMDKKWNPKKIERVRKRIVHEEDHRVEEVVEAKRTEKGVQTDVTEQVRQEYRKRAERAENKREKQELKEDSGDAEQEHSVSMGRDEIYPFSPQRRALFSFKRLSDARVGGKSMIVVETEAKEERSDVFEGTYYIDKDSFDIVEARITPAKMPRLVRELRMKMTFDVLPGEHYVIRSFWMRMYVNAVIKKIRFEVEERYDGYEIRGDDSDAVRPAGGQDP